MTTGIYLLTFATTANYVGQSINVEERFQQHLNSLDRGTSSKPMQEAYRKYGYPTMRILMDCHPDHLDFAEAAYIHTYLKYNSLNTTLPRAPTDWEVDVFNRNRNLLVYSLPELLDLMNKQTNMLTDYMVVVENLQDAHKEDLEQTANGQEVLRLRHTNEILKESLDIERRKPWYNKLFR